MQPRIVFALCALSGLLTLPVRGERFVLRPVADTSLVEAYPTNNFGGTSRLRVGGDEVGRNRALLKFDLSALPATSRVVHADLKLTAFMDGGRGRSVGAVWVFRTFRDWIEGNKTGPDGAPSSNEATWTWPKNMSALWQAPGGLFTGDFSYYRAAQTQVFEPGIFHFTGTVLNDDVQSWVGHPEVNFGFFLYHNTDDCLEVGAFGTRPCYALVNFASREDAANAPELTVYTGNPDVPRAFINGSFIDGPEIWIDRNGPSGLVLQSPYPDGRTFFTTDGSAPSLGSTRYTGPIAAYEGEVIRAVTYSSNYVSGGIEMMPVTVHYLPDFALTLTVSNGGGVSKSPPGALVYPSGNIVYASNTVVHLQAVAEAGWVFAGWSGDVQGSSPSIDVTMNSAKTIHAEFTPISAALTAREIQRDWILLSFEAKPTFGYRVQSSPDLRNWTEIKSYTNSNGTVEEILPLNFSSPNSFYRLITQPAGGGGGGYGY